MNLTGSELEKLARKHISDEHLKEAFSENTFREFARIFLLFINTSGLVVDQESEFGHAFYILDETTGKRSRVEVDIKVRGSHYD